MFTIRHPENSIGNLIKNVLEIKLESTPKI